MDSALFHLIEEFIIKECDSRDIEYTPTASRAMRRNLNKVLTQLRESEYEKNANEILNNTESDPDTDKDVKKRKRSDTNLLTESENETESDTKSEPEREDVDRDYDDSEHKYNYSESIILPINIKYCLGITYISIIFSVYSSLFYIVTQYSHLNSVYNVENTDLHNLDNVKFMNNSKSCL
jgi:hypothetical protein